MGDQTTGLFLVVHDDEGATILRDVQTAQIHTLEGAVDLEPGEIVSATIEVVEPHGLTWTVEALEERRTIPVEPVALEPTRQVRAAAGALETGGMTTLERAGEGVIDVLCVDPEVVDSAVEDVATDRETVARAARLGADRVEIRSSVPEALVSVRYLPA